MSTSPKKVALIVSCALVLSLALGFSVSFADSFSDIWSAGNGGTISFPTSQTVRISTDSRYQPHCFFSANKCHFIVEFDSLYAFSAGAVICRSSAGLTSADTFSLIDGENVYLDGYYLKVQNQGKTGWFELDIDITSAQNPSIQFYAPNRGSSGENYTDFTFAELEINDSPIISQTVAGYENTAIPAGYALRISSNDPIDISSFECFYVNSWNFPQVSGSTTRTNGARLGLYDDTTIIQGASADLGTLIPWTPLNANLFGRASNYSYSSGSRATSNGFSYVITNPLYGGTYKQSDGGDIHTNVDLNVTINYSYTSTVSFDLIPLKAVLNYNEGIFTYSNLFDLSSGVISGTVISGEGTDAGEIDFGTPPQGGGNSDEPPLSENTTLTGLFRSFVNSFNGFFNSAVDAINTLIAQGSSFMSNLASMFTWLPEPLFAVLVSALILCLTIGVIKLLF